MGPECWNGRITISSPHPFSVWLQAYSSVFSSRSPAHHKVIVLTRKLISDIEKISAVILYEISLLGHGSKYCYQYPTPSLQNNQK